MSTRYVWNRYTSGIITSQVSKGSAIYEETVYVPCKSYTKDESKYPNVYKEDTSQAYDYIYPYAVHRDSLISRAIATYPYVLIGRRGVLSTDNTSDWYFSGSSIESDKVQIFVGSSGRFTEETVSRGPTGTATKVAASSSSAHPSDGESGSYWYIYQGADYIDPTAVSYSNNAPKGGEEITVTVTPRSNTYGGTISYQYQYQVSGGSWTNSGSKTTATSKSFTVPKGATSFRVRVLASDNMGFTSSDYVYGSTIGVQNLIADIGVANVAREIDKMYIGVNGVAREVVAAYIGVNGVARELF